MMKCFLPTILGDFSSEPLFKQKPTQMLSMQKQMEMNIFLVKG